MLALESFRLLSDSLHSPARTPMRIGVQESEKADPMPFDVGLADQVVGLFAQMRIAVEFNSQPEAGAIKIDNIGAYAKLPAKF